MLNTTHRFHGYNSLRRTYSQGTNARGVFIGLKFAPRQGARPYRVAVVVGKKVNKSAVVRNRIRRRVYEAVRTSNITVDSLDLIFTVFNDKLADISSEELASQIDNLLLKTAQTFMNQKP
jgi:ribonuclease P protein component